MRNNIYNSLTALTAAALSIGSMSLAHAQDATATPAPQTPAANPAAPAGPAAPPAPAAAATTAPAAAPEWTYSGLIDMYTLYSFNNPKNLPNNSIGGYYDVRQATPTISLAELNIAKAAPATGGFGYKTTLIAGDTADLNHGGLGVDSSKNQEARFKNIQQLYATYISAKGYGIDFGKFYTPFGYEVTESNANYNYSRSDVFSDLLPFYHLGFRAYTPSYNGLIVTLFLVNALNNGPDQGVYDTNGDKGYLGQLNYTDPKGKFVAIENIGYSKDKISGTKDKTTLSDTDFTYNIDAKTLIGLNYVYRKDEIESIPKITANGYAAYLKYMFDAKQSGALRYSYVDNKDIYHRPWDVTATYSYQGSAKWLTRAEYRYDRIYAPGGFANGDVLTSNPKTTQSTVSVSEVFTF